jgi:hypothetical protein
MISRRRLLFALPAALVAADASAELLVCGREEVFAIRPFGAGPRQKVWSWKAVHRPELPAEYRDKFQTTDECKPVDGGRRVLITASSGGVALVERPSGEAVFYAQARNAHSAELLPHDRIVVAASVGDGGNRLILFDIAQPAVEIFSTELYSGHGVVWDAERETLWALGGDDIREYGLRSWSGAKPELKLLLAHPLPTPGGHDLQPSEGPWLNVSSGAHCYRFHRDERRYEPHPELADMARVKCISRHPTSGRIVYTQGRGREWWTSTLRFLHPEGVLDLPEEQIYKARWFA